MKKTLKIFLKIGIVILLLGFLFIQYLKSDFNNPFDEKEIVQLKLDIKDAKMLPSNFIDVFDKINPITNTNGRLYDGLIERYDRACPCLYVARIRFIKGYSRIKTNDYVLAWKLEKEFTQEQCLSYYAEIYDFMNQNVGINKASKFYFDKTIKNLDEEEMSILTLVMRNSALYNPLRNMKGIKKKLSEIKN
jgi:hypothetical protein